MKTVIQRVQRASVTIGGTLHSSISAGMLVLVGIQADDTDEDISWLAAKIANLRIFDDEEGVMNRSILETGGDILAVSQFTLMARTRKGNRPSYIDAAKPEISVRPSPRRHPWQTRSHRRLWRRHAGGTGQRRSRYHPH